MSGESKQERKRLSRRTVVAAAGAIVASTGAVAGGAAWLGGLFRTRPVRELSPNERRAFAAAQARLLPSEESAPGAPQVHATTYLESALLDPGIPSKHVVHLRKGIRTLDAWAKQNGASDFVSLAPDGQDRALRAFAQTGAGLWWMRTLLGFTLEALLGDPARGANPQQRGWQWARHRPGFPRPVEPGWRPTERTS